MAEGIFPKGQVFSGARAQFTMNGNVVGYATGVSGTEDIQYEAVEVLDHLQVIEFVPVAYRVSLTASRVRLIGSGANTAGSLRGQMNVFPKMGADDHTLLRNLLDLIALDMSVSLIDTITGRTFMNLEQIVIPSKSFVITPRGIVGEDITILGIRARDEQEV